jgi:sporulation protein YlmC with PRC-barrel domain
MTLADRGRIPLVLRLLDHQVIGHAGQLLGKVDDLVLEDGEKGLRVVGLLSGPPALARRLGRRSGGWLDATWRRLRPDADPSPRVIPLERVLRLDSGVHLDRSAGATLAGEQGLERWLREHVVGRIPGASGAESDPDRETPDPSHRVGRLLRDDERTLSDLLGFQAVTEAGDEVGEVVEVTAERVTRAPEPLGPLRIGELVCSVHHLGQELGYTTEPQGPALLRWLLRLWHRQDRHVSFDDVVALDWGRRRVVVSSAAELRHPHDVTSSR